MSNREVVAAVLYEDPDVRVGTRERNAIVEVLGEHHAAGRLTDAETEERRRAALAAVYRRDLLTLLTDLPHMPD